MIVLMIGSRLNYLRGLAEALHLRDDNVIFAQTGSELAKIDIKAIRVTFVDLLWLYSDKNPANIGLAIRQLRKSGYAGTIEACANNLNSNSYIARLLGGSKIWEDPEEREYPDLSLEEVAEKLAPLLAA
ncbi:MAG: hypothetical protein M1324_01785 [Patescibacteria group bacterium]|nr:hypothetical protein [Patescibacteria group bacterium]